MLDVFCVALWSFTAGFFFHVFFNTLLGKRELVALLSFCLYLYTVSHCLLFLLLSFVVYVGFQAGPTFPTIPTFFLCSYFSLLFSENALLSLLFSPKMFEVTKNCNFFPGSLEVC